MPTFEVLKPGEKEGRVFHKKEDAAAAADKTCRILIWEKGKKIAIMAWTGQGWFDRSGRRAYTW